VVQKKFEDFKRDVGASSERYTAANNLARRLVAEGHSDTVLIKEKQDAMRCVCMCVCVCVQFSTELVATARLQGFLQKW